MLETRKVDTQDTQARRFW